MIFASGPSNVRTVSHFEFQTIEIEVFFSVQFARGKNTIFEDYNVRVSKMFKVKSVIVIENEKFVLEMNRGFLACLTHKTNQSK